MFKCLFCGLENSSEKARFCVECGPDNPAKSWTSEEIDQPAKVAQYITSLSEIYFDTKNNSMVEKFSLRWRERLQISFDTHSSVITKLETQKKAITHLANFRFEFNENVIDAYAGHDTFLNFRYTNLSEDDLFKVGLFWDDSDTLDRIDIKAETKSFVKPMTSVTIGASAIFDRIGMKELSDLQITITDQFGESANFRVEPFVFKVGNHDQKITQNISTHNQISIEGRGVVDASGMGTDKVPADLRANTNPQWKELSFVYVPAGTTTQEEKSLSVTKTSTLQSVQQKVDKVDSVQAKVTQFKKDDLLSVLKSAEEGNDVAQNFLGDMYLSGKGVAQDYEKALHWFSLAAEQGHADAQSNLGIMYEVGLGVIQDYEKAADFYRLSAEQGNADGQSNLGMLYETGVGVPQDHEKAVHFYRLSAEQGNADGQTNLGHMYKRGLGVAENNEKAVHWFRLAAEKGDAGGQSSLGFMYEDGLGVPQDYEMAVNWYRLAAEQGNDLGQNNLGFMYQNGFGVAKNDEKAFHWYQLAAEQGFAIAQNNLGLRYQTGLGVAENHEMAVHWFRLAAEQGNANAQENLGFMYQNGFGVAENNEKAAHWYRLAADQGNTSALESLIAIEPSSFITQPPSDGYGSWDYGNYTYTGMFENGQWNGLGELIWSGDHIGHKYIGNFVNGIRQGQGTYTFPDGTTQVGIFENNVYQESETKIEEVDADCELTWDDGTTYSGKSVNGIPNGFGTMIFGGDYVGHKYIGNFVNGIRQGQGTYTFPDGTTQIGRFENNEFLSQKNNKSYGEFNSIDELISYYAMKKIVGLGVNFFIQNSPKFDKKVRNFSQSFSEVHIKSFDTEKDTPILFYDGTILGSGTDGIVFTANSIYAKGCLGRSVKHVDIAYSQIESVKMTKNKDKAIFIESLGHAELIALEPIYANPEDILIVVEMLNKVQQFLEN